MNFRFTLNSALGEYELARNPIGWDKISTLFKRSTKYHGVFYEKTIDLGFYCGAGKEYVDEVIDTLGIDTAVSIKIEIACGCLTSDAPKLLIAPELLNNGDFELPADEEGNVVGWRKLDWTGPTYILSDLPYDGNIVDGEYSFADVQDIATLDILTIGKKYILTYDIIEAGYNVIIYQNEDYDVIADSDINVGSYSHIFTSLSESLNFESHYGKIDNVSIKQYPESCVYDELYLGKLDLKTWSTVDNKSSVNIIQEGVTDTVINRADTVIDLSKLETLDGTALTAFDFAPYEINLHSKKILLKSQLGGIVNISDSIAVDDDKVNAVIPYSVVTAELDTISEYSTLLTLGDPTTSAPDTLFTALSAGTYHIVYDFQGTLTENMPETRSYDLTLVYRVNGGPASEGLLHDYGSQTPAPGDAVYSLNYSGTLDLALAEGDTISFYMSFKNHLDSGVFPASFTYDLTGGSIIISLDSLTAPTTAKAYAIFEAGARIAQSITNQTDAFRSDYFGRKNTQPFASAENGCASFGAITNGALIRNFPIDDYTDADGDHAGRPVKITFNKYFDSLNAIYNLGMGIEKVSDVFYIRMEKKEYFYQDTLLFQLSNVPNLKISAAPEYYYNKLNIGYEQWQIEQINGLDEFNSVRQYDLGLKVIDNTLEQKSSFIAGGYLIEVTRRKQYPDSFTEDGANDNDNFIICTNRAVDGGGIPTGLDTAEIDENFDSVSNILSPETSYNLRISPARNALRWSNVTSVGLLKYPARNLKLTYGEGNFKMESEFTADSCPGNWNNNLFSEGQDIQWDDADNTDNVPLWIPLIATFNYPLNRTQAKILQNNPYGYIEVSERSIVYEKWFILEAKYNPVGGMTEFKLLKKWQ